MEGSPTRHDFLFLVFHKCMEGDISKGNAHVVYNQQGQGRLYYSWHVKPHGDGI